MTTAAAVIRWLESLKVTEGPLAGELLQLLTFERRFVSGLMRHSEAALSVARGNGKTTLCAGLGACAFAGPLSVPRAQIVIVASSLGQARITFNHARWFLRDLLDDRHRYREIENSHECRLEDRETGASLRALGSDPRRAHGLAPLLAIADEPAQWPARYGSRMHSAIVTALGKHEGAKFIAIGTSPDENEQKDHWFKLMLKGGPGIYAQVHAATRRDDPFAWSTVRKANPAVNHMPALKAELMSQREKARRGGSRYAMWRALRLNMGTPESTEREVIVTVDNWQACVFAVPPPREGPVAIGFDLGGSSSMTAATAYWPQTGRLEARGAFPADPGLKERGMADGVGDRYVHMAERGEVRTYPGKVTPVGRFLIDFALSIRGEEVIGAVADRYRKAEAEQALAEAGVEWEMEWRATGAGQHGSADIRAFQAEVLEAHLRLAPSLLMESAIADAAIGRDTNGNPRLDKGRTRGRIDALQAAVLAVGLGRRWRLPGADEDLLLRYYERGQVEPISV